MLNWRDPRNPLAGGAERVTLAFMKGLIERGHKVDWFTFAFPGCSLEEEIDGVRIRREGGIITSQLAARRWYRSQERYDLVIDQHHGIPWFAPWWCRTHCIAYIHEVLGPIWSSFYRWPTSAIGRWQERWTQWLYRRVVFWVPSDSTRQALARHGVKKVHVLPNGVDVTPLPMLQPKVLQPPIRLIAVSRLAPNKRVDHAIQALAELRRRGLDASLTIVGDGMMAAELRALTARLGVTDSVVFAGFVSESAKLELLQASHVLVHPSVREGWGLNVIEANAMGTPGVVYPVDGLVDSTIHEVTGCICRGGTPRDLADSVAWLVGDQERFDRIRERAWQRSGEFRWEVVKPRVSDFLEAQAAGRNWFDTSMS